MRQPVRVLVALLATSLMVMACIPGKSTAEPYFVLGYLKDENGMPIANAALNFSGRIFNPYSQTYEDRYYLATTDSDGRYMVTMAVDDPDSLRTGDKVTVTYKLGSIEGTRSMTLGSQTERDAWFNITHEYDRSFGDIVLSPFGLFSIVVIVSAILVGYYVYKGKVEKAKSPEEDKPERVTRRRRQ